MLSGSSIKYCLSILLACVCSLTFSQAANKKATKETQNLRTSLNILLDKGIMFGHQDALAYGIGWKYQDGRSDIKEVTGQLPAVFGWDVAGLERNSLVNIDSIPFNTMRDYIRFVYDKGLINTISWHLNNPLNGKSAWNPESGTVEAILPNGSKNTQYNEWLDKLSDFLLSLKGSDGKLIPILFRPYHEFTGDWFWWGKKHCSPQQFKDLWKYTFNYLNKKGVNNLLYVYNAADFKTEADFLERYPADKYVDIISFDAYDFTGKTPDNAFANDVSRRLSILEKIALDHKKIPALAEAGYEAIPYSEWYTQVLWKAIGNHKISHVLLWRNAGYQSSTDKEHFYAPYHGHTSEADFIQFFKLDKTLFEKEISNLNIYK